MSVFSYKAKNSSGELVEGLVDATSKEMVATLLVEKNLTIIEIEERDSGQIQESGFNFFNRVKVKDLVIFFRQFAVMVRASLPIVRALRILVKQTKNERLKVVVAGVADEVDGGSKLSDSMAKYPDVFGDFYISVIRSGETSGRLSEVVEYLADQQERDYDLQAEIKNAMIYPSFIIAGLVVVGFIIVTFVVPQMTSVLTESGADIPFITKVLIFIGDTLSNFWWLIVSGVLAVVGIFWFYVNRTIAGMRFLDKLKLRLPIFGNLFDKIYIVRMSMSFATLLKGGVPVSQSLDVVRDVVGNVVYQEIITQAIKDVDEGSSVSESFASQKQMPIMVSQMLAVGEETGKLEEVLERITGFYSREINMEIKNLATIIEPIIMIFLGVAVGLFMAAVVLPMWQLSATI